MSNVISRGASSEAHESYEHQAYQLLHWGFVAAPVIAGLDKFSHVLTNWDAYLAPPIAQLLGGASHGFMLVVGVVEVIVGFVVAMKPRVGAYLVAAWLAAIIVNLLISGRYLDIALRDFGLFLAALALGRLAQAHDRHPVYRPKTL